jgi:ComF family protein
VVALTRPVSALLDLALPPVCAGCGAEGDALCRGCRPGLDVRLALPAGTPLGLPEGPPDPLVRLEWCAPFAGTVRRSLHALKYAGERRLAEPLGAAVAARWACAGGDADLLVPVPVHASRRRERGYDQAELIAASAARHLHRPMLPAVERIRATTAQYRLDRRHRASNVATAFAVRPGYADRVAGRHVVLVDDVVTTGATLSATANALLAAGATSVAAVTVARER